MRLLVGFTCLAIVAGCNDDDKVRHLPDAPPPPDADVDASPFGPVSLTVMQGVDPQVGVRVIFQNADSTVVADTTTGTDGKASTMMAPGGYVTAIDPYGGVPQGIAVHDLRTFAGVKPGDQLQLFQQPITQTAITVNLVLPIEANAAQYAIWTNCFFGFTIAASGSGAQPMGTVQMAGCAATGNLLVVAHDAAGAPISSIYKQSVALTDNVTIDLSADTYTAVPDVTYTYANLPAQVTSLFVNDIRATSLGKVFEANGNTDVTTGAGTFTAKIPAISNATAVTTTTFLGGVLTQHVITEWGPAAASYTLDGTGQFLPGFDTDALLDIPNHMVKWTASGGAVQPDFSLVRARLIREVPLQQWEWTIVTPSGTDAVLPVLPEATFNPIAGDLADLEVRTGKVPGGYDGVRANILAVPALQELTVGAAGKAVFALYTPGKPNFLKKPTAPTGVLRGLVRFTPRVR